MQSVARRSVLAGVLATAACAQWDGGAGNRVELAVVGARVYATPDAPPIDDATILPGLDVAIDAGVDILAHAAPMAGPWDNAFVARMQGHHMALVPTLTLFGVEAQKFGQSEADAARDMQIAQQQLRAFRQAGGEVLFGTDVGYTEAYDTSEEFRLMRGAGFGFREILTSLTTEPARRFGHSDRKGQIAPGMDADIVVLSADPAQDIEALARVRQTIRTGEVTFSA